MNVLDVTLSKLAEVDTVYAFKLHCTTPGIECPPPVLEKHPNEIVLNISNRLSQQLEYDWDNQILSFYASFNGVSSLMKIPTHNIRAIIDEYNGTVVQFGKLNDQKEHKTPTLGVVKNTGMNLLIDRNGNFEKTERAKHTHLKSVTYEH